MRHGQAFQFGRCVLMEPLELDVADFLREMRRDFENPPSYGTLYKLMVTAQIEARRARNKWWLPASSKAMVAELLGLKPKSSSFPDLAA
jgi:hypothetical protein